ncbi:MAG: 2-C-methyl-D-erythritol 4-phosphate cytidylyltransferase [Clostridia bacterium]|nr:2-C-methyl-D-erythritol 4-phosphate cytidylyltransferase [Clostridia bacterium]
MKTAAIIVAAGSSRRMGSACPNKLLLKIKDIEVLARTLIQYQRAKSITSIYVVTHLAQEVEEMVRRYGIDKFAGTTPGGETRQHSVQNGLALCKDADLVAVADGARPFTKPENIDSVTAAAAEHGGAILCVPLKDTVKITTDGLITSTPPRATLLAAQTPQTFHRNTFAELMDKALKDNKAVTDDASVFELYGKSVYPVIGDYDNIKITTVEDILQAETIAGKESV